MKLKLLTASILALLVLLSLVAYQKYTEYSSFRSIDSYESCAAAKGSVIQESYPATCITRLGSRFTQLVAQTNPIASPIDYVGTGYWLYQHSVDYHAQIFSDPDANFTFQYPNDISIIKYRAGMESNFQWSFVDKDLDIQNDTDYTYTLESDSFYLMEYSTQASIIKYALESNPNLIIEDKKIGGHSAKLIIDVRRQSLQYIINLQNGSLSLDFHSMPDGSIPPIVDQILSTFKLTDQVDSSTYTCPANGWQSCMPILSEEGKKACSKEAIDWYKTNCPNFEGIAQ